MIFLIFLFILGISVTCVGTFSIMLTTILVDYIQNVQLNSYIIYNILAFILLYFYNGYLQKAFIKLYIKLKIGFNIPSTWEALINKLLLSGIMLIQCNAMHDLILKLESQQIIGVFLTTIFSLLFGFAIKFSYDSLYDIKKVSINKEEI